MAISTCHALGSWESYEPLTELLGDLERELRQRAIHAITHLATKHDRKEDLSRTITDQLDRADNSAVPDLLDALAKSGRKASWTNIERHLRSDSPAVRAAAAYALGLLEAREAGDAVLNHARSEQAKAVRLQLAPTLHKLGQIQAVPVLIGWLEDGDEAVKIASRQALTSLTGQNFLNETDKWKAWWEANKPK
jgi:hypothetical protein